jgi:hypothetical protein
MITDKVSKRNKAIPNIVHLSVSMIIIGTIVPF